MIKTKTRSIAWCYISVYLLLLFKAGFMFIARYSAASSLLLLAILFVLSSKHFDRNCLAVLGGLIVCTLVTGLFEGIPDVNSLLLLYVNLITALLITTTMSKRQFFNVYSDIIFVICSANLFFHFLYILGIPLIRLFPVITNSQGLQVNFAIVADYYLSTIQGGTTRLLGIFWEPGAFQALIVIAFCIELFRERKKRMKYLYFVIFIITLFLTYSTTAFICLVFLLALLLSRRFNTGLLPTLFFLALLIFAYNYFATRLEGYLYHAAYGKINMLLNSDTYGETASTSARSESIIYGLEQFFRSPIWGIGQSGQEWIAGRVGHTMMTCTPINYFAYYGLFCGILSFWGFFRCMDLRSKTLTQSFLLVTVLLLTTSSENFTFNPILTTFMFYGYQQQRTSVRYESV